MKIGDYLRNNNIETYKKLKQIGENKRKNPRKKNQIKLGDRPEKLMQHDVYKRVGRRVKQIKWGGR